jgi:hypothetical protein
MASNNGTHPTANQQVSHARLGRVGVECAAGDAGRYASSNYRTLKGIRL